MKERKYDLALIRTLGGTRFQLSLMLIYESLLLTIIGFFIGIGLSRLSIIFISKIMDANFNYSLNNNRNELSHSYIFSLAHFVLNRLKLSKLY